MRRSRGPSRRGVRVKDAGASLEIAPVGENVGSAVAAPEGAVLGVQGAGAVDELGGGEVGPVVGGVIVGVHARGGVEEVAAVAEDGAEGCVEAVDEISLMIADEDGVVGGEEIGFGVEDDAVNRIVGALQASDATVDRVASAECRDEPVIEVVRGVELGLVVDLSHVVDDRDHPGGRIAQDPEDASGRRRESRGVALALELSLVTALPVTVHYHLGAVALRDSMLEEACHQGASRFRDTEVIDPFAGARRHDHDGDPCERPS
eukprot:CAMPEP_0197407126 /NCGR_PEP_ID=MMETSP1165-20131217/26692_1 /TAXON_ID=284809 /ORGANISM="Chrysocystis fragilis, Strain CCMP3189" /LENGTH=261 /DNA_ID=CAMNT_0042933497 /DNA_START=114 /DNA_END=896 /DNA_ORIENTATION=-